MKLVIRITQKIKDQNTHLDWVNNASVGDKIVINKSEIPQKFFVTKPVAYGYRNESKADLRHLDGWRALIPRTETEEGLDLLLFKENKNVIVKFPLNAPLVDVTHYEYKVVALSQIEIEENLESVNNELSVFAFKSHIEVGEKLFEETYRKIWRRENILTVKDSQYLTESQADDIRNWVEPVYIQLRLGNWLKAKRKINQVFSNNQLEIDSILGFKRILEELQSEIINYFDNNWKK